MEVAILRNGAIGWMSHSGGAGAHADQVQLKASIDSLSSSLGSQDGIALDGVYASVAEEFRADKTPPLLVCTSDEKSEPAEYLRLAHGSYLFLTLSLSDLYLTNVLPGHVERVFGEVKNKFGILRDFRSDPQNFQRTLRICLALHNLHKFARLYPNAEHDVPCHWAEHTAEDDPDVLAAADLAPPGMQ